MEPNDMQMIVAYDYNLEWYGSKYWLTERAVYIDGSRQLLWRYPATNKQISAIKEQIAEIKDEANENVFMKPQENFYGICYRCSVDDYRMKFYHTVTASDIQNAIDIFHNETSAYCSWKHKIVEITNDLGKVLMTGIKKDVV